MSCFVYFWRSILILIHLLCFGVSQESSVSSMYGCNSTIRDGQGYLYSPNFPNSYDPNNNCLWQITVEENRIVFLSFSRFEVERSLNCAFDYVAVFNGPSKSHPELEKFCGAFLPPDVQSTFNRMLIMFHSDGSNQKNGFFALFQSVAPQLAETNSCGGLITQSTSGTFHSVNFPKSNYPNSLTCVWHIRAAENQQVVLSFKKLTVEPSHNCKYDSVVVLSGWSSRTDTRSLGRFCNINDVPEEIVSDGNELFITFSTDSSGNDVGFLAAYSTRSKSRSEVKETENALKPIPENPSQNPCPSTEILNSDSGVILSPDYKVLDRYLPNLHCSWGLETSHNSRISLRFANFQLEQDENCVFDYVIVYDGRNESGEVLGQFCGNMENRVIESTSNQLFIVFVTDSSGNNAGFRATYTSHLMEPQATSAVDSETTAASSVLSTSTTRTVASTLPTTIATSSLLPATTRTIEELVSCDVCPSKPFNSEQACNFSFVASIKVLKVNALRSGNVRARVLLIKMLKLEIPGVTNERKTKFFFELNCPQCFPTLTKKSRYIFAGHQLEDTSGQIALSDYIELFSKKTQKKWVKGIRRCAKSRRTRRIRNKKISGD